MIRTARVLVLGVALCVGVLALFSCGGELAPKGILAVVRVEQKMPDGSFSPVVGARVLFELYGSRADDAVRCPLYQQFEDTTDAEGLAVPFRDPQGKAPSDIGMLLVDVIAADGRTAFKRRQVEPKFDFGAWAQDKWPGSSADGEFVRLMCSTAVDFPDCKQVLENGELVRWGVGLSIRIQ